MSNGCLYEHVMFYHDVFQFRTTYEGLSSPCRGGGIAGLNDLTGYAGGNFRFLVGPPKPDRPYERGQTKRGKLVLQAWWFCGWVGNPPKENKVLISKDAQP
jgi:hypothetical protein